jgi:hypothetical protein
MEFYLSSCNPVPFIGKGLAILFNNKDTKIKALLDSEALFDKKLFEHFASLFNNISITRGVPNSSCGQYGQTVKLSHSPTPTLDNLLWGEIPWHLIIEGMPYKPNIASTRYGYQKSEEGKNGNLCVTEEFFFEFLHGYRLETFSDLSFSLKPLRYLSSILCGLDSFVVVLMDGGIYVSLKAHIANHHNKPDFFMSA